jgi:hypothetical protein
VEHSVVLVDIAKQPFQGLSDFKRAQLFLQALLDCHSEWRRLCWAPAGHAACPAPFSALPPFPAAILLLLLVRQEFANVNNTSAEFVIEGTVRNPTSITINTKMVSSPFYVRASN